VEFDHGLIIRLIIRSIMGSIMGSIMRIHPQKKTAAGFKAAAGNW